MEIPTDDATNHLFYDRMATLIMHIQKQEASHTNQINF